MICSIWASHQRRPHGRDFRMISIDVRRSYFYAKTIRPVYIEIPKEDWEHGDEDNVARLNFSHGDHESHQASVNNLQAALKQRPDKTVALMLDTKGPEIRTGVLKEGKPIDLVIG